MLQPLIDVFEVFSPGWMQLPPSYGAELYADALAKGAGHRYIRRVPTGKTTKTGKPRYRYYYHAAHGGTVGNEDHFVVGASFRDDDGHWHITARDGDRLTLKHDETGEDRVMTSKELREHLVGLHKEAIAGAQARARQDIADARASGASAKQVARLQERAARVGAKVDPEAPKAEPKEREKKPTPGKLEAVGDHIWGSRKDLAQRRIIESSKDLESMSYADAAAIVRKSKLIDPLTIAQAKERGMTPGGALAALTVMAAIREKPDDTKASRAAYVDEIRDVMGGISRIKTAKDGLALVRELASQRGRDRTEVVETADRNATMEQMFARADQLSKELGRPVKVYGPSAFSHGPHTYRAAATNKYDSLGARFKTMLDKPWKALSDANRADDTAMMSGDDAVWSKLRSETMGNIAEAKPKAEPKPKTAKTATVSEKVERVGGVPVNGADPERVRGKFGFREVDYGKDGYMTQADREHHTKALEEATHDLVDALGIDPAHASFNGRLGIALGARGSGKAAAHYESGRHAINITKVRGGGSYAHEWGHALDDVVARHYLPDVGQASAMGFTNRPDSPHLPPDVRDSVQRVMRAMNEPADPVKAKAKFDEIKASLTKTANDHRARYDQFTRREGELSSRPASEQAREEKALALQRAAEYSARMADDADKQAASLKGKAAKYYATEAANARDRAAFKLKQADEMRRRPIATAAELTELESVRKQQEEARTQHNEVTTKLNDHVRAGWKVTDFKRSAGELGEYWRRPHEMFARGFETFVADELAAKGRKNTYLTSAWKDTDGRGAYPSGEERTAINDAMRDLVRVLHKGGHLQKALASLPALTKATGPLTPLIALLDAI